MKKKMLVAAMLLASFMMVCAVASACDHVFGGWIVHREPTCFVPGDKIKYCKKCDHWENEDIPKLKHQVENWVTTREPTCTKTGIQTGTCSLCNSERTQKIETLPHNYGELEVVKEPRCNVEGSGRYVCIDCGQAKKEKIDKLGHDWQISRAKVQPTCTKKGSGEMTCTRCGKTKQGEIPKLTHEWSEWETVSEPENGKKGERRRACALCGDKEVEHFYAEGTLYQDMPACPEVIQLQTMMKDIGYYGGAIKSGKYGEQTSKAVAKFQKSHKLKSTGVADPETFALVQEKWEAKTGKRIEDIKTEL